MRNCVVWCVVMLLAIAGTACRDPSKTSEQGKAPQEDGARGKVDGAGGKVDGPPKEFTVALGGGVNIDLVLIPAGSFMMGDEQGSADEKPVHKVTITKPFYLGKYEVTREQWQAVMGNNPSRFKGPKNPVEQVNWNECQIFLAILNERSPSGVKFGLPTEAQWEYACRAGTTTKYSFGDDPAKLGDYAWWKGNAKETTHPVGQKKPNAWGLYDMHGNVWEWCADGYVKDYYATSPVEDPDGPDFGATRVWRGGSWQSDRLDSFRCAFRDRYQLGPEYRSHDYGFRVVMTLTHPLSSPVNAASRRAP